MYSTLINYTEEDSQLAERLYVDLLAGGVRPWMAAYDVAPGDDDIEAEQQALSNSQYMVVLLTKKYLRNSIAVDLTQSALRAGKKVIPVLADIGIKTPDGLPEPIKLKKRYAEAVQELLAALPRETPLNTLPALQRGNAAFLDGAYEEALDAYSDIKEHTADSLNNRAAALNALRQHEEALQDVSKAIEINPHVAKFYVNRSLALSAVGRHEEALTDDQKALELEPQSPRVWSSHSMTLYALNRLDEAVEAVNKAIEINADEPHYYYQLGMIMLKAEKYEEAIKALDMALHLDPENTEAAGIRQIVLGKTGRVDEALEQINREIKRNPRQGGNYVTRSLINFYLERYEDAVKDATAALERGQQTQPAPFYNRAIANWKLGNQAAAQDDLLKAIAIYKDLGTAAGIRGAAESDLTREPGLEILAALQADGKI